MQTQNHDQRPKQIPSITTGQKAAQSAHQIINHSAILRLDHRTLLAGIEAIGLVEATESRPEHESLPASGSVEDQFIGQQTWDDETDPSRKTKESHATDEERLQFVQDTLHAAESLTAYLLQNFAPDLSGQERKALDAILEHLDQRNGFLTESPQTIADTSGFGRPIIDKVLALLRQCDPEGIGCENKQSYRMFLLEKQGSKHSPEYKLLQQWNANPEAKKADLAKISIDELEETEFESAYEEIEQLPTRSLNALKMPNRRFVSSSKTIAGSPNYCGTRSHCQTPISE